MRPITNRLEHPRRGNLTMLFRKQLPCTWNVKVVNLAAIASPDCNRQNRIEKGAV